MGIFSMVGIFLLGTVTPIISCKNLEEWNLASRQCQNMFLISEEVYTEMQGTMKVQDPTDNNQRCFVECTLIKGGIMTTEGELNKEQVVEMAIKSSLEIGMILDESLFYNSLEYCSNIPDEVEYCWKSYNTWLCFLKLLNAGLPIKP